MDVRDIEQLVGYIETRIKAGESSKTILTELLNHFNHIIQQPEYEGKHTVLAWKISSLLEELK